MPSKKRKKRIKCPECKAELEIAHLDCPFCGGDDYLTCPNCYIKFSLNGDYL